MKTFWQLVENVKNHTTLNAWLYQIKEKPKDVTMWLALADFLQDQGGLSEEVANFIRDSVGLQRAIVTRQEDQEAVLTGETKRRGEEINAEFENLGYTQPDKFSAVVTTPKKIVPDQIDGNVTLRGGRNLTRMVANTDVNTRGGDSRVADVALHDTRDYNFQLLAIFNIAQRMAVNLLRPEPNAPSCKQQNSRWLTGRIRELRQAINPRAEFRYPESLLILIRSTWDCCGKWKNLMPAVDRLQQIIEWYEQLSDETGGNQDEFIYSVTLNVLQEWEVALRTLMGDGNADEYRKHIAQIVRRFRNEQTSARALHWQR